MNIQKNFEWMWNGNFLSTQCVFFFMINNFSLRNGLSAHFIYWLFLIKNAKIWIESHNKINKNWNFEKMQTLSISVDVNSHFCNDE